jgi:DNA-binding transcriptional LysR family regulator
MLTYLDEVARCGSIRKAAQNLNVASTSINRQIIALEGELGQPIFERLPGKLRLTATGEALIDHIRDTLRNFEKVQVRLDGLKGMQRGQVRIATTIGMAAGPMAGLLQRFLDNHPGARVILQGLYTDGLPGSLLAGEVDLALGFNLLPNPGLKTLFHFDVPLGLVVSADHELTRRPGARAADIIGYPLVLPTSSMSLRGFIDIALSRLPEMPVPQMETNSIELIKRMVGGGQGVTLLNPLDVGEEVAAGQLRYLPLKPATLQTLKMVARTRGAIDTISSRFVEHVRHELGTLLSDENLLGAEGLKIRSAPPILPSGAT